jgi:uncharacterized protein
MEFEWDKAKSDACFEKRGFHFAAAAMVFNDPDRLIDLDDRLVYGELRYRVIGKIGTRVYVVVFTPRQDVVRIISARKANQREVRYYENRTNED